MIRLLSVVTALNSHAPTDGPPDAFGGSGLGTLLHRTLTCIKGVYNFANQGGAISSINLLDDLGNACVFPPNALILESFSNWTTAVTSAGSATVALGSGQSTTDLLAATAKASLTGLVAGLPVFTAATTIALGTTSTGYQMEATIAVAALTAGVANIYAFYVL
jgi:hypothetical protein